MTTGRKWRGTHIAWIGLAGVLLGVFLGWRLGMRPQAGENLPVERNETTVAVPASEATGEREILYWTDPMLPDFRRDKPGKSPMGHDLVPVYAEAEAGIETDEGDTVALGMEMRQNLGVRTGTAEIRPLWRRIEATGYVGFDEDQLAHVHVRTEGWIDRLHVNAEGERVKEGQLLFEFYSPEMVNAQKEFLAAHKRGETRLVEAAREKLRALGMSGGEIDEVAERGLSTRAISVFAPTDGAIRTLNIREGQFARPEDELLTIADLSRVWMQAEVFEAQADWVAPGQAAEARLDYLPGEVFAGKVDYVYPVLDPRTRTLRVRVAFDNPRERLKPNMYAAVTIFGRTHQDALTIPRDALIRAQDSDRVIVALAEGRFRAQEVMTGIESGEWVEIVAGLEAGERVVVSGQFLIDSEASLSASLRRLESPPEEGEESAPRSAFGSGIIEAVDREGRRLKISHGPIDALGWPAMTMEFEALPGVDLARVRPGMNAHFSIRPDAHGAYAVDMIHLVAPSGAEEQAQEKELEHGDD